MQSKAATVQHYLSELPEDRRTALEAVRRVVLKNLDKDFEEGIQYGMIGYYVPHKVYPPGYHCDPNQPLPFCRRSHRMKNYMSIYLMCVYGDSPLSQWFRAAWAKTGKKLDMGKSCVRFKQVDDLALDVIGEAIKRVTAKSYIAHCEAAIKKPVTGDGTAGKSAKSRKAKAPSRKTVREAK